MCFGSIALFVVFDEATARIFWRKSPPSCIYIEHEDLLCVDMIAAIAILYHIEHWRERVLV